MGIKYPKIRVKLVGQNGNAFVVLGLVSSAMKKASVPSFKIVEFKAEAMAGDYNHLLRTCMEWVNVE